MTKDKKYNPMLSSAYNLRFFAIDLIKQIFLAAILDKYRRCANEYKNFIFYWQREYIQWEAKLSKREIENCIDWLKEIGVLIVYKRKEATSENRKLTGDPKREIKQSNPTTDNSNFYYIILSRLLDDDMIAELMPLSNERNWKSQEARPSDTSKFDEECQNVRQYFKEYIRYLIGILSSPTESVEQVTATATPAPDADEQVTEQEAAEIITTAIRSAFWASSSFRSKNREIKYKRYVRDPQIKKVALDDAIAAAKRFGINRIFEFVIITIYNYLSYSTNSIKPAEDTLNKQLAKLLNCNGKEAEKMLNDSSKEFESYKEEYPDYSKPKKDKPKPKPKPKQEEKPISQPAPQKQEEPRTAATVVRGAGGVMVVRGAGVAGGVMVVRGAGASIRPSSFKQEERPKPKQYSSLDEALAEIDEEWKQKEMKQRPTQEDSEPEPMPWEKS